MVRLHKTIALHGILYGGVEKAAKLMGLQPDKDLTEMDQVSRLKVARHTAQAYQTAGNMDNAEKNVLGMIRQLKSSDYNVLTTQCEKTVWGTAQ